MTVRNLDSMFRPASVAVIGASAKAHSVGAKVLRNLVLAGFAGEIFPVNPKYAELQGLRVFPEVSALPHAPDLAIVCTPPGTLPQLVAQLGSIGTRAAVVLSAGLDAGLRQAMLDASRPHLLRILGPNCVGLIVPEIGLNASFAHTSAIPGKLAFVSQSGAMVTAVLDWARSRGIGFSKFVSLGDGSDVDFGDLLDYLASDQDTRAILLYVEGITSARKFMSAARAAARSKPTIMIKAGRVAEGARAAASHTGALAGADRVYDAAIRRAGMLRVYSTEELFDAVETVARMRPLRGEHLAILTNGGGPGVLATDELVCAHGKLAPLAPRTVEMLNAVLPANWSGGNPVDIIGDAPVERYVQSLRFLLADPNIDATLIIHAPTAMVPSAEIAAELAPLVKGSESNVLGCWLGAAAVADARRIFDEAGIPTYESPEKAVRGFMQMVQYRRNQQQLLQVPAAAKSGAGGRPASAGLIATVLAEGRQMLSEPESKQLLAAYGIPVVRTRIAADEDAAVRAAAEIGFPVVLKILSRDITHKSDVGGVALDLPGPDAVAAAAAGMRRRLGETRPGARLDGFSVQQMVFRPEARELIVGVSTDPAFGPVILFGQGGVEVEVIDDNAIALPPLNSLLARDLVSRTRISRLLQGYRNRQAADMDAIVDTLMRVSALVAENPELVELDINPLLADAQGVIALDVRVRVQEAKTGGTERLAIRPYPAELEEWVDWQGGRLLLRPIRPEDGEQHLAFFNALTQEDIRMRVFTGLRELQPAQLARLTQIDYDREMAFIASRPVADGKQETLGVARAITDPDNVQTEFAIIVRSDLKGKGLGKLLMRKLIDYSRARGTRQMVGETLNYNIGLLNLVRDFGFQATHAPEDDTTAIRLDLQDPQSV